MQRIFLLLVLIFLAPLATAAEAIPKVWDEAALADWVTPIAGLNVRPSHIPAKEYYSAAVYNLRTYPVYFPGREPKGYWEMLQHIGHMHDKGAKTSGADKKGGTEDKE